MFIGLEESAKLPHFINKHPELSTKTGISSVFACLTFKCF